MEESLQLRVGGLVLIFGLSVLSFAAPTLYMSHLRKQNSVDGKSADDAVSMLQFRAIQESDRYRIVKCGSTGVILGVAMLHLLNDSIVDFAEVSEYPFALLIAIIGMVFGLATDNIANYIVDNYKEPCSLIPTTASSCGDTELAALEGCKHDHDHNHDHCSHDHDHTLNNSEFKEPAPHKECAVHNPVVVKQKAVIKASMMEIAIATHTIIIGFGFGAIEEVEEIKVLMAALAFHQFFEGVSLGLTCADAALSWTTNALLGLLFALSWVVGVILGIYTSQGEDEVVVQATFNALAAGLLMHTAIIEMIAEDFNLMGITDKKNATKLWMLLALIIGIASMAILAIFA